MAQYEMELISAIKNEPELAEEYGVYGDLFEERDAKKIFNGIMHLAEKGITEIDDIILSKELADGYKMKYSEAASIVAKLPYCASNIAYYSQKVRESWQDRRLKKMGMQISHATGNIDERIANVEKMLTELRWDERKISNLRSIMPDVIKEIERRYHTGNVDVISTGWSCLDGMLCGGFHKQELAIIGARTSIGKTTCALNLAQTAARNKKQVGFFSAEMSMASLAERIMSKMSGVDLTKIRTGSLTEQDLKDIMGIADEMAVLGIWLDDTPNISLKELWSKARKMKRNGVDIIFIDYLTLIRVDQGRMERFERVGFIAKQLKQLARELNMPVVTMSQLNREAERMGEPGLETIRQSGEIEEDSDTIIFLWRDKDDEELGNNNLRAKVAKARNGRTGKFGLYFDKSCMRIEEYL